MSFHCGDSPGSSSQLCLQKFCSGTSTTLPSMSTARCGCPLNATRRWANGVHGPWYARPQNLPPFSFMLDIFTTTTMEDALRYLKDNPGAQITATARLFNVDLSTLNRRSRGVIVSRKQYLTTINKNLQYNGVG
jgi:hypothetical protein